MKINAYQKYKRILKYYKNSKIYGYSTLLKPLYYFTFGNPSGNKILIQAGIHAREWITIFILDKFVREKLLHQNLKNQYIIVFCSNPDGFRLATFGLRGLDKNRAKFLYGVNKSSDFSLWKANINAVDINVNFDAEWGKGAKNVSYPNSENYVGKEPNSESETQSLINLTKFILPDLTISLHTKGEEVYYYFNQPKCNLSRDKLFASNVAHALNYSLKTPLQSVGGYKDWCIQHLSIPALTIELGSDNLIHPIGLEYLNEIYSNFSKIFPILESF